MDAENVNGVDFSGCRILVADSNRMSRRIVIRALSDARMGQVIEVADGLRAWMELEQQVFHLVLAESYLEKIDGLELADRLRRAGARTPVIMMTREANREQVVRAMKAGVVDYLIKPFESDRLIEKVKRHLSPVGCQERPASVR